MHGSQIDHQQVSLGPPWPDWLEPPALDEPALLAACQSSADESIVSSIIVCTNDDSAFAGPAKALVPLLRRHAPAPSQGTGQPHCQGDGEPWPCDAWRITYLWACGSYDPITGRRMDWIHGHFIGQICPPNSDACQCFRVEVPDRWRAYEREAGCYDMQERARRMATGQGSATVDVLGKVDDLATPPGK